ncbi:MAG: flagellar biosynthesis anti-sigma factor FlgM [Turneriella sp.]|nr:flagellar biosynthesis anti-sigma factor FlgM [Turneriella sp.]
MNIDRIHNKPPVQGVGEKPVAKPQEVQSAALGADSVSISQAALQAREAAQAQKAVAAAADLRADRVREAKEKLARGEYDNLSPEVLNRIADRLTRTVRGI